MHLTAICTMTTLYDYHLYYHLPMTTICTMTTTYAYHL